VAWDGAVEAVERGLSGRDGGNLLAVSKGAWSTLSRHIGWGQETEENQAEQGGLLVGRVLKSIGRAELCGLAEHAIPGWEANGSMAHLHFGHDAWRAMLDAIGRLEEELGCDLQVIGWYHTHPKHLSVFMSGTDCATQRRMFSQAWHFSVVLNPQRKELKVFHGADAEPCRAVVL
jgi:proteasome lid subunit RPN8/RPN11